MADDDIVRDILRLAVEASRSVGSINDSLAASIELQVRKRWGGEQLYIAHGIEQRRAARDERICDLWENGQRDIGLLAARFGLSPRQIRRILGQ